MSNDAGTQAQHEATDTSADAPVIEVVAGSPTDEELAALVAVISASATSSPAGPAAEPEGSGWGAYWRRVRGRGTPPLAADAWRRSFR